MVGLTGCVLFGLSFFSLHAPTHGNYQLLWLLPTHLALAFARPSSQWQTYTKVALVLLVLGGLFGTVVYYARLLPEAGVLLLVLGIQLFVFSRQCSESTHSRS